MATNKIVEIPFLTTKIQQQTEGGLINIDPILKLVNEKRKSKGLEEKRLRKYIESKDGQEYVSTVLEILGKISDLKNNSKNKELQTRPYSGECENTSKINQLDIFKEIGLSIAEISDFAMKDLKRLEVYKDTRGKNKGIWFTPLLAIEIVGWLDPQIRAYFNQIVLQELFKKRITLSEKQKELTDIIVEKIGKPENVQFYSFLGFTLNEKIFGKHYKGIRDTATKDQFEKMIKLIDFLCSAVRMEIVENYDGIFKMIERF